MNGDFVVLEVVVDNLCYAPVVNAVLGVNVDIEEVDDFLY